MSLSKQEFTDAGRSMLGRAQNGERLTISKIVVGSGAATQPSELWPRTALIVQEMNVVISTRRDYGQGTLLVEGSLRSDQAPHAFDLREVGVMAHIGAEADRLYSVANCFAEPPDHIDPAAPTIQVFKIKLIVDRIPTGDLIVQIGPSENVTGENIGLDTTGPGPYKEALGNVLRFKRLRQGIGMEVYEEPGGDVIYIGRAVLHQNLDLYVPLTYQGITDPDVLFPTIQAAHDYLLGFGIPTNLVARIHVDTGHFALDTSTKITHPDARQIQILGRDVIKRTVTGNITSAGPLPNVLVTLNIADVSGIAVNDVVHIHGAPHFLLEGCGVVTVSDSRPPAHIVVKMIRYNTLPPASIAAGSAKVVIFPTQVTTNIQNDLVFNFATGIGLLKNFAFRGTIPVTTSNNAALGLYDKGDLQNLIACNLATGFGTSAPNCSLFPVIAANGCDVGIQSGPGGVFGVGSGDTTDNFDKVVFSGNIIYGVWLVKGSYIGGGGSRRVNNVPVPTATYVGGNGQGIRSDSGWFGHGVTGTQGGGIVVGMNGTGLFATIGGVILTANDSVNGVQANTLDARAENGGQIAIVHNVNTTGTYNPPNQQLGPSGGYIDIRSP